MSNRRDRAATDGFGLRRHAGSSSAWRYAESGSGRPLVLLHGIGMSHRAWDPVVPHLSGTRRVIAFDVAGFGSTPPLPAGSHPTVVNLVDAFVHSLRAIGLDEPVDIAGHSLGGCLALEAATRGVARTVVAVSPACLWRHRPPWHVKHVFRGMRIAAVRFPGALKAAMARPLLRELVLAVPLSIGSRRMPPSDAVAAIDDLANATAFEETFNSTRDPFRTSDIHVPVTVAFGDRDWILPKRSRYRDALPAHVTWIEKRGWGHAPMWVDSQGVAQLILEGSTLCRGS